MSSEKLNLVYASLSPPLQPPLQSLSPPPPPLPSLTIQKVYMNITTSLYFSIISLGGYVQYSTVNTRSNYSMLHREFSWNSGSRFVIYCIRAPHRYSEIYIGEFTLKTQTHYIPEKTDTANRNMHITNRRARQKKSWAEERESWTRNRTRFPVSTPLF